jgi:hypothetical protein
MSSDSKLAKLLRGGVEIKNRTFRLKSYPCCFKGNDAVDFIVKTKKVSVNDAIKIGNRMIREKIFHHVHDEHLLENSRLFYRFYADEDSNNLIDKKEATPQQQFVQFRLSMSKKISEIEDQLSASKSRAKLTDLVATHQTNEYKKTLTTFLRIILILSGCVATLFLLLIKPFMNDLTWYMNILLLCCVGYGGNICIQSVQNVARRYNIPPSLSELLFMKDEESDIKQPIKRRPSQLGRRRSSSSIGSASSPKAKLPPAHQIYPDFPSLRLRETLSNTIIHPNSRAPIPFSTPNFHGKILFMLNTKPQDEYYKKHFKNRKRTMEVHIQGQFILNDDNENNNESKNNATTTTATNSNATDHNESTLFIGGELKSKMTGLGSFARGIAKLMLKMIRMCAYGAFDSSFGNEAENVLPHIVTSLYQGVDRFVVTQPGDTPPILGQDLPETDEERKLRGTSTENFIIDSNAIYSFSYQTMYIDFLDWQVIRIPGFKAISLEGYWGRQSLFISCYSLIHNAIGRMVDTHRHQDKKYFWQLEIQRNWNCTNSTPEWPEIDFTK